VRVALIAQPHYVHTKRLILRQLAQLPYEFFIVDTGDGGSAFAGIAASSNIEFVEAPGLNQIALASELDRRNVDHVISFSDRGVVPAAQLREALGHYGNSVETENAVVNKAATRQRLRLAGLSRVQCRLTGPDRLEKDAAAFRPPFIVKPASASGSLGVELIRRHEDLPAYLSRYRANKILGASAATRRESSFNDGALVIESFIEGSEFSVEGVVVAARAIVLGVTASYTSGAPFFIGLGHDFHPHAHSAELSLYVQRVVTALGMTCCPFHIEMMKTDDGYEVIEAHTRFGGGLMMELVAAGTGFLPFAGFIELLLGADIPDQMHARPGIFSQHYICTEDAGTIAALELSTAISSDPRIISYALDYRPGDVVESGILALSRLGYVTFAADDELDARAFRRSIDCHLELRLI
jgi:predicted ATP-grasp superfamily ATP-dependent carboligase